MKSDKRRKIEIRKPRTRVWPGWAFKDRCKADI